MFVFSYCQSPDSHGKATRRLPGNNPSKPHHLRRLSHSRLCIWETFASGGISRAVTPVFYVNKSASTHLGSTKQVEEI